MSHLLKNHKKTETFIKATLISSIALLFYKVSVLYVGSKFVYLLFSLTSIYLLFFSFRKKSLFYENFFGTFLFLGFWFKFSVIIGFGLYFGEGFDRVRHEVSPKNIDDTLLVSMVGFLAFIIYGHIREFYIYYPENIKLSYDLTFYEKYRNLFISIFVCLVLSVCFANIHFKIYQRGLIGVDHNFLFSGFIKTSLLYFLALCSAIILYFDLVKYKKVFIIVIFIFIFESFCSSLSMLSRGMIFNSGALLFGLYKFTNKLKIKFNLSLFLKTLIFLLIIFFISVSSVNYLRIYIYEEDFKQKSEIKETNNLVQDIEVQKSLSTSDGTIKEQDGLDKNRNIFQSNKILNLIVYRWVGLESLLLVTKNKEILNFDFFIKSLNEKFTPKSPSFYEINFNIKSSDEYTETNIRKGNTLPGIITFLFFSGSYIFLFFSIFILCFFASIIEFLTFKLLGKNMLAASIIAMAISYRYAHFGYLPKQSYLLFGSIIGVIFIFFIVKILYTKFNLLNKE